MLPTFEKNRQLLTDKFVKCMKNDKAKHHVLPPTNFGSSGVQITRQRVKPVMNIDTSEQCPMCEGNGKIDSSLILVEKIEAKIHNLVLQNQSDIHISTHPFTASYLNKKDSWLSSSICKEWSN